MNRTTSKANLPRRIQGFQRKNEAELLQYLRIRIKKNDPVTHTALFSNSWLAALERLLDAGKVVFSKSQNRWVRFYKPVKNARPVTNIK